MCLVIIIGVYVFGSYMLQQNPFGSGQFCVNLKVGIGANKGSTAYDLVRKSKFGLIQTSNKQAMLFLPMAIQSVGSYRYSELPLSQCKNIASMLQQIPFSIGMRR